jgi:hypothetical protein
MDPPQDGDDEHNVVGGMMGRLGFEGGHVRGTTGHQLIEQLGLGEGSRVVDLQVRTHQVESFRIALTLYRMICLRV